MLCSVQITAEGAGYPRRSDTRARQIGSLACYIIVVRPVIVRHSSTRYSKSNQLELSS
jgi:hypothetical protein